MKIFTTNRTWHVQDRQLPAVEGIGWGVSWARLNIKTVFPDMGIPMLKIRGSWDHLIFNMEIPILVILLWARGPLLYPHSTRRRSMVICVIWKSVTDRIGLEVIWGYQRYDYDQLALRWCPGSNLWDGDLMTTDRQSTFCKAAIKPNQITFCWRSDATRKRSVCAPMAMLEIYGVQFPVWLRCRWPLLIRLRRSRSDYDQIATCWLQSYKCRRRLDAIGI